MMMWFSAVLMPYWRSSSRASAMRAMVSAVCVEPVVTCSWAV
jgi:hypothetical protein